jgi:hypothetical protein
MGLFNNLAETATALTDVATANVESLNANGVLGWLTGGKDDVDKRLGDKATARLDAKKKDAEVFNRMGTNTVNAMVNHFTARREARKNNKKREPLPNLP